MKTKLEEELSLPFDDTEVYFDNKMIEQNVYVTEVPKADISGDSILTVICTGKPGKAVNQTFRDTLNEVKIADVRYFNTSIKIKPWITDEWTYEDTRFNLDDTKVPWPLYRDWT